jgi:hypothetical protein
MTFGPIAGSPCFMYATLNYGAATATPHGPWKPGGAWDFKSCHSGMLAIPASFVTAQGMGSKRLAVMGSAPSSIIADYDVSIGPALTAVVAPTTETEGDTVSAQKLMGYAPMNSSPGAGRDRATRPGGLSFTPSPVNPFDSWSGSKWNWLDTVLGGTWIHGTSKSAWVSITKLSIGLANYVGSDLLSESLYVVLNFVSEADLAQVQSGAKQPYEIQPSTERLTWAAYDSAGETATTIATISSISASAAEFWSDGATFTVDTTASIPSVGSAVSVSGTSSAADYHHIWRVISVVDGTHVKLGDPNGTSTHWSGTSATGGVIKLPKGKWPDAGGINVQGVAWNPLTCKFYVLYTHPSNTVQMARWTVNAGC